MQVTRTSAGNVHTITVEAPGTSGPPLVIAANYEAYPEQPAQLAAGARQAAELSILNMAQQHVDHGQMLREVHDEIAGEFLGIAAKREAVTVRELSADPQPLSEAPAPLASATESAPGALEASLSGAGPETRPSAAPAPLPTAGRTKPRT